MPAFDGTGPGGLGPMTGRGEGYCAVAFPPPGTGRAPYGYAGVAGAAGGACPGPTAENLATGNSFRSWQGPGTRTRPTQLVEAACILPSS